MYMQVWEIPPLSTPNNSQSPHVRWKILIIKPEQKRPLCKFIHKWEDIKKQLQETGHESTLDSSGSADGWAARSWEQSNAHFWSIQVKQNFMKSMSLSASQEGFRGMEIGSSLSSTNSVILKGFLFNNTFKNEYNLGLKQQDMFWGVLVTYLTKMDISIVNFTKDSPKLTAVSTC